MSDSLRPHGLQHASLPYPSPSPRVCCVLYRKKREKKKNEGKRKVIVGVGWGWNHMLQLSIMLRVIWSRKIPHPLSFVTSTFLKSTGCFSCGTSLSFDLSDTFLCLDLLIPSKISGLWLFPVLTFQVYDLSSMCVNKKSVMSLGNSMV